MAAMSNSDPRSLWAERTMHVASTAAATSTAMPSWLMTRTFGSVATRGHQLGTFALGEETCLGRVTQNCNDNLVEQPSGLCDSRDMSGMDGIERPCVQGDRHIPFLPERMPAANSS